jgi:hypothetical protein
VEQASTVFEGRRDNRHAAVVVVTADGRRAVLPLAAFRTVDVSLLGLLRSLLVGIEDLLGLLLIAGSRRENGGIRRNDRS